MGAIPTLLPPTRGGLVHEEVTSQIFNLWPVSCAVKLTPAPSVRLPDGRSRQIARARSQECDNTEHAPRVASAVREVPIGVTTRAARGRSDTGDPACQRLLAQDCAHIELSLCGMRRSVDGGQYLRADFVTAPADGRPQPDMTFLRREPKRDERVEPMVENPRSGTTPSCVKGGHGPRRVPHQHRRAIGNCDREGRTAACGDMPIGRTPAQPPTPAATVHRHHVAVYLVRVRQPRYPELGKLFLERGPASHDLANGLPGTETERPAVARGRPGADVRREVGHGFRKPKDRGVAASLHGDDPGYAHVSAR